ncbi:glycosyltransferase family 4 protein [Paenibacillus sp. MMS20-IR301]|uniref:glycosyltransferase family 4 protein n=1 Tax=Paenibacillus sp. MMS20-IR301 TaxID=2895946 RepID=UPI0028EB11D5|nr:glycosyltransferase family 4 protein [Paenibacillus sp. MMS20-IR301]WNS41906.1 glycosyltransferase family 4 protein [Paenibacillus sp. MMS20-IR301]
MRICIIAPEQFPVPGDGSVEICIWNIARRLARRHQVTIISRSTSGLPATDEAEQVRIIRLPSGTPLRYRDSVLSYLGAAEPFDIIQVDNRPLLLAAVKRQHPATPVLLFLHSLTFVPPGSRIAASLALADAVAANSRSLQQRLARRFPGLHSRLRVVPLGADLSRFVPVQPQEKARLRAKYGLAPDFTVLFVGRVIPRKGVPVLIRAMHRLNRQMPARLLIAGGGKPPYIRRLKLLARRLGVRVSFLGSIPHEDIHSLYQSADCFICPSQRHESFGLVNVEAMATGLPVIASSNGGIREIITSGQNGYLVKQYRSPVPFARRMLQIGRSPSLAARIGLQGRTDALQMFEWQHTAELLENLYLKLAPQ